MSEFAQGLTLSGIGILTTFSALGILILLILGLKFLFPAGQEAGRADLSPEGTPEQDRERLKETAAAVGVAALLKLRGTGTGSLGKLLEQPAGKWWELNLDRLRGKE